MVGESFDPSVLEVAVSRRPALLALAAEPHHRQELEERLGVSKTTCHRIIRTFDEYGLIERTDRGYALSTLGSEVASRVEAFEETVRGAYRLAPLLAVFADLEVSFPLEHFADATVTEPRPADPMQPVDRACELFFKTDSSTIRAIDRSPFIPSAFVEEVFEAGIEHGLHGEFVFPAAVARERIEETARFHRRMPDLDAGIRYWIHEEIPFGMTLYEQHVDLRAYDEDTGAPIMLVDTDDPDAVTWASDVFETYREQATPASAVESIPDWLPEPDPDD